MDYKTVKTVITELKRYCFLTRPSPTGKALSPNKRKAELDVSFLRSCNQPFSN